MDKIKILVIVGPTASGKTALSISCAEKFGGEIVSADSMQIYEGLDIATAKPTADETHGIKHYMIGFLPADKTYSVADYVCDAEKYIKDIHVRGKLPIIVGGTGLYIDSLVNNIKFTQSPTDNELRVKLQKECEEKGSEAHRRKFRRFRPHRKRYRAGLPRACRAHRDGDGHAGVLLRQAQSADDAHGAQKAQLPLRRSCHGGRSHGHRRDLRHGERYVHGAGALGRFHARDDQDLRLPPEHGAGRCGGHRGSCPRGKERGVTDKKGKRRCKCSGAF